MFKKDKTNDFAGVSNKTVYITGIVVCLPIFLLAAFLYYAFTPAKYEVSARIAVNKQQQPQEIINDIRANNLVGGVVSKMQLMVGYYHRLNLKTKDIYGDSLPVKLVMLNGVKTPAEVKITILNNQRYEIDKDDTIEDIPFNRPETYEFGHFMVVRGPVFKVGAEPVIIKLNPETALVNDYKHNLDAKADEDGFVDLSVKTTSVAKGKYFLKLLSNAFSATAVKPVIAVKQNNKNDKLDSIISQLQVLNAKAAGLRQRQALLASIKKQKIGGDKSNAPKSVQQQVLEVTNLPSAKAMRDSIRKTDIAIKAKLAEYRKCRASKPVAIKPAQAAAAPRVLISPKQSIVIYPERPYIFVFALFAGLVVPVVFSYVLVYIRLRFFKKAQQNRL